MEFIGGFYINMTQGVCETPPRVTFTAVYAAVCSTCFLFGMLYCFFGYRFFKATMFLTGFMFGSLVCYVVIQSETSVPVGGKIGIILASGLLCGLVTMLVQYVGLFMTGFLLGQLAAVVILIVMEQFYHPSSRWIAIGILFSCGVVFALINLYFQRGLTIISSSAIGAAAIAVGTDYFVEDFVMFRYVMARIHVEPSHSLSALCWYSLALLAVWPTLTLVGVVIQFRLTGRDKSYDLKQSTLAGRSKKKKHHQSQQQSAVQKKPRPPSVSVNVAASNHGGRVKQQQRLRSHGNTGPPPSYRQLYMIRRTNGDVISQSYHDSVMFHTPPDTVHLIRESTDNRLLGRPVYIA